MSSSFPRRRRSYDEQSLVGIGADSAASSIIHNNNNRNSRIHQHLGLGIPGADAHQQRQRRRRATMTSAATNTTTTLLPANMKLKSGSMFASSPLHHRPRTTVRTILGCATVLFLLLVIGDIFHFFNDTTINDRTTDDIKELTQTVMRLSQELHDVQLENERNRRELELANAKAISSIQIEADESQQIMKESVLDRMIQKNEVNITDNTKTASSIAARQREQQQQQQYQVHEQQQQQEQPRKHNSQSGKDRDKHIQLREALASSIEELDRVRRKHKMQQLQKQNAPIESEERGGGGNESGGERPVNNTNITSNSKSNERLLRGGGVGIIKYQLGDGIETINDYGIGKKEIALRPGVISDINSDGTFNLFQLESSHPIRNIHREGFRLYQVYTRGTSAFYEERPKNYVPITIASYVQSSARPGLEVHGNYLFTYDADEDNVLHEGRAMLMYRYAGDGEIKT